MIVSAIVPIFNEERTIKAVAKTLIDCPLLAEVIFVNDGSTDRSLEILKNFDNKKINPAPCSQRCGIKIINFKRNHGKGFALTSGIKKAKGEIVAFFDGDLLNFSQSHIEKILEPIFNGNFQAVLGVPLKRKSDLYRPWVISLTGERVYYRKDLLPHLRKISKTRYGVEIFLNSLYDKKETKIIPLEGLISPTKWKKRVSSQALKEYILEIREIAEEFGKRKGLLPEDYRALLKYLNLAKRKFRNFLSEGR